MESVEVQVSVLLRKIRANKKKHDKLLKEAWKGYWKACDKYAELITKKINEKNPHWGLEHRPETPKDHSDDYDSVVLMLEMCSEETIELSRADFEAYVMNRWSWRKSFLATCTTYGQTGPEGPTGSTGPEGIDF